LIQAERILNYRDVSEYYERTLSVRYFDVAHRSCTRVGKQVPRFSPDVRLHRVFLLEAHHERDKVEAHKNIPHTAHVVRRWVPRDTASILTLVG